MVVELTNERKNAGSHKIKFDGSALTSGIYFSTLSIDGKAVTRKRMVLIK